MSKDKNITLDRMRYKHDSLSSSLTLLGLLANVFYFVCLYKNNNMFYYTMDMGSSVIYNLLFMLLVFLSSEEVKVYNRKFSVIVICVGLLQLVRIFIVPSRAIAANTEEITVLATDVFTRLVVYLCISAALLIIGGAVSFIKSVRLTKYKQSLSAQKA